MAQTKENWDPFEEIHLYMCTYYERLQHIRLPTQVRYVFADHSELKLSKVNGLIQVRWYSAGGSTLNNYVIDTLDEFVPILKSALERSKTVNFITSKTNDGSTIQSGR